MPRCPRLLGDRPGAVSRVVGALLTAAAVALSALLVLDAAGLTATVRDGGWSLVVVLVAAAVLLRLRMRWRIAVLSVAVIGSLAGYVVVAAPRETPAGAARLAPPPQLVGPPGHPPTVAAPPVQRPALGVSVPTIADLDRFIIATHTHPDVVDIFEAWSRNRPLDPSLARSAAARGAALSITWMPWDPPAKTHQPDYTLTSIIDGRHDAYIDMFARSVAQVHQTVTIRLMHEMNGTWYPWAEGVNGNRPGEFVAAWRHVHDRFAALGVTNVRWMWSPNALYQGAARLAPLYPGDDYVDVVGLDNYNWGRFAHDGSATEWATFDQLFDYSIAEVRSLTSRPLWIAEVGSSDYGGSKATWLADTLAEIQRRTDLAGFIWFDHDDTAAGVDWRIDGDPTAVRAWHQGFVTRPLVRVGGGPGRHAN